MTISDTPYDMSLWVDSDDEGLGARDRRAPDPARPPPPADPAPRPLPEWTAWPLVRNPCDRTRAPWRREIRHARRDLRPHLRTDRWWLAPAVTAAGLLAFVVYSTWRAFANADYYAAPYVSPFYSPCLAENCEPMRGGPNWELFGSWWGISPAIIILIFPLGFRLTCYYYRKAYYRSFWASPPACAVAEPHATYTGETRFPLILQNVHRYFFYAALLVACVLTWDTVLAFRDENYAWGHMGLGTLVFLANIVLIWAYTLSCHSCRHIVGGKLKHFSKHPVRYRMWQWVGG